MSQIEIDQCDIITKLVKRIIFSISIERMSKKKFYREYPTRIKEQGIKILKLVVSTYFNK